MNEKTNPELDKQGKLKFRLEVYKKDTRMANLTDFDNLAKDNDYCEVSEWNNGEGFDINIFSNNNDKLISITNGQFKAIKACIKSLNKDNEK